MPILAIVMRLASSPTADASYLVLAFYALRGPKEVIQSFFLSWLFTMINTSIAPTSAFASIGRYIVMLAALLSIFHHRGFNSRKSGLAKLSLLSWFLVIFIVFHSLVVSPLVDVSILKALSWLFVTITLFAAWGGLDMNMRLEMEDKVFGGLIAIMIVSLPLLLVPSKGYAINSNGFQGILNHPQAFGTTMALLEAWLVGRLFVTTKQSFQEFALLCACLVLVVLSGARTAGLAIVIGVIVSSFIDGGRRFGQMLHSLKTGRKGVVLFFSVSLLLFAFPFYSGTIGSYLQKGSDSTSAIDLANSSRGDLVSTMTDNIEQNPFLGIGFGIASLPSMRFVNRDPLLGLPVSASVEKGVMPLAILEELGLIGFLLVLGWFLVLIGQAAKNGFAKLIVIITVIAINFGESMFFSAGGMGLLMIILVTWAATSKKYGELHEHTYA